MMFLSVLQQHEVFIGPKPFHYLCMENSLLFLSKHSMQSEGCCTNMVLETSFQKCLFWCDFCSY